MVVVNLSQYVALMVGSVLLLSKVLVELIKQSLLRQPSQVAGYTPTPPFIHLLPLFVVRGIDGYSRVDRTI